MARGSIILKNFSQACLGWSRDADPDVIRGNLNRLIGIKLSKLSKLQDEFRYIGEIDEINYVVECDKDIIHAEIIAKYHPPYTPYKDYKLAIIRMTIKYSHRTPILSKSIKIIERKR